MNFDEKLYEELMEKTKLEIKHLKFFHLCLKYCICPNCHNQLNMLDSDTTGCVGFKCCHCDFNLNKYIPIEITID